MFATLRYIYENTHEWRNSYCSKNQMRLICMSFWNFLIICTSESWNNGIHRSQGPGVGMYNVHAFLQTVQVRSSQLIWEKVIVLLLITGLSEQGGYESYGPLKFWQISRPYFNEVEWGGGRLCPSHFYWPPNPHWRFSNLPTALWYSAVVITEFGDNSTPWSR